MDFPFNAESLPEGNGSHRAMGADAYSSSDSDSDDDGDAYRMPVVDPADGEWSEFHPRKRRRTGRDTKESAALGIFGSESEDDRIGSRGKARKPLRRQGMSFVSSGQKAEEEGVKEDYEEEDDDEDDDENEAAVGVGLGFPTSFQSAPSNLTSRKPLSFQPTSTNGNENEDDANADTYNPLGQGFVPSSASEPVLRPQSQSVKEPSVVARPSAFSQRSSRGGSGSGGSSYNLKSFGARMMAKMGFVEGQGLGTEGQGRSVIIEANLRPQGVGLGAVREKSETERQQEKRQARLRGEEVVDSDEEERKSKAAAAAARKKKAMLAGSGGSGTSGTSTPRRSKTKYMTMDEAKRAAPGLHIPDVFTPILDMTGPGRKLLTTTSSAGWRTPTSGGTAASPGFVSAGTTGGDEKETAEQAEARKVARRAQNDFMAILEEWQSLQHRKAFAELQSQQERQELEACEARLQGHQAMTAACTKLVMTATIGDDTGWLSVWDRTIQQLLVAAETIQPSLGGTKDALADSLADISVAALHPVFQQALVAWQPLEDPHQHLVDGIVSIQGLLGWGDAARKHDDRDTHDTLDAYDVLARRREAKTATPYETMVYTLWLPPVLAAVRDWDVVHDTERLLALYEAWLPVLPGFVRAQLLDGIVRRLDETVARWEPKRRRTDGLQNLPHLWLFPWLPYLPAHHLDASGADGLVVQVKRKFRQLVDVWEFYRGVVPGLLQWKAVLRPAGARRDEWRPLVLSHVLPAMARYVRAQFRVDPHDQAPYLEVITGEFQWLALLAPDMVGEVMVAELFPLWHAALYTLLTSPSCSLAEIGQWFRWWADEFFPDSLQRLPRVATEFQRGLVLVNEALDLGMADLVSGYNADRVRQFLAPPERAAAPTTHHSQDGDRHHRHHRDGYDKKDQNNKATVAADVAPEEMSIRHYVEEWCESNDVQFLPERKKLHAEGRPLYRLTARGDGRGGVLVYFQGMRVYVETKKDPVEIRVDREEDWTKLRQMAE